MLSQSKGGFSKLWANEAFTSKVINIVWDEGQCIANWKDFRKDYRAAGNLRFLIPKEIRFYLTSATLPTKLLAEVETLLGMRSETTHRFSRTNDRPNVHICVRQMKYPLNSFDDLAFLVPSGWDGSSPLPYKFVIFFDSIDESIKAGAYLRARLPLEHQSAIETLRSPNRSRSRIAQRSGASSFMSAAIFSMQQASSSDTDACVALKCHSLLEISS